MFDLLRSVARWLGYDDSSNDVQPANNSPSQQLTVSPPVEVVVPPSVKHPKQLTILKSFNEPITIIPCVFNHVSFTIYTIQSTEMCNQPTMFKTNGLCVINIHAYHPVHTNIITPTGSYHIMAPGTITIATANEIIIRSPDISPKRAEKLRTQSKRLITNNEPYIPKPEQIAVPAVKPVVKPINTKPIVPINDSNVLKQPTITEEESNNEELTIEAEKFNKLIKQLICLVNNYNKTLAHFHEVYDKCISLNKRPKNVRRKTDHFLSTKIYRKSKYPTVRISFYQERLTNFNRIQKRLDEIKRINSLNEQQLL